MSKSLKTINLLLFILTLTLFTIVTGCYGPKAVNKWVDAIYGQTLNTPVKPKDDYFSVSSKLVTGDPAASSTVKQTKHLLPLIVYWQADYINTCTLNPKIPINTFTMNFKSYSNSKGLKQKLNGGKIELTVDKVPNVFSIKDRGRVIWVIYAFGWDDFSIIPENKDMIVSYRIIKDNTEIKKGVITVPTNLNKEIVVPYQLKRGTWEYLSMYDDNIKSMTKEVVDQIMEEL